MVDGDSRIEVCRQAAMAVLARHGWCLLDAATLAVRAAALLPAAPAPAPTHAERACQQVYARALHAAARDPAGQAAAYRELHAYLYRIARHQRPDLADDAAQEAILLVYQNIDTCRDPAAFLKFAIYQLLTAFHRLAPKGETLAPGLAREGHAGEPEARLPGTVRQPEAEVAARDQAAACLRWLRGVIAANPRARNQILAVTMKYLEGRDDREIAAALGTSVPNVQVLRSRGLDKLRAELRKHPCDWLAEVQEFWPPPTLASQARGRGER